MTAATVPRCPRCGGPRWIVSGKCLKGCPASPVSRPDEPPGDRGPGGGASGQQ